MKRNVVLLSAMGVALSGFGAPGCLPGRPRVGSEAVPPDKVIEFAELYGNNCAGCHGANGRGGAAIALADPVYLAVADDTTIRRVVRRGVPRTSMPAFARSAGGMLTDQQIDAIVDGMRLRWKRPDALGGAVPPPLIADAGGDPMRGAEAFGTFCASCHGADGRGTRRASSVVDGSYLALMSDQGLRTFVIVGRSELGAPNWRSNVPGTPMSNEDVADVVAWLASQRPEAPGQPYPAAQPVAGGPR
jgi:mono/diheme cytochrome c family protein